MNTELVQWQKIDTSNGCVFPWFTHPFLAELSTWDLSDKNVLEYGSGRSTAWWATKAKWVVSIEANKDWADGVRAELSEKGLLYSKVDVHDKVATDSETDFYKQRSYIEPPVATHTPGSGKFDWLYYDIIVIDGILRYECLQWAEKYFKEHGGIIIFDNWQQDGFICPACEELMKPYEQYVFPQPGHTDHHGNCWKTAFFIIPGVTN